MESLRWITAAALSAYACHLAVHHTTPIDQALPFIAVAVTLLAWLSCSEVMLGVPLLVVAEMAVGDETVRLLIFGTVVAAAVALAVGGWRLAGTSSAPGSTAHRQPPTANPLVVLIALLLLRWLPIDNVRVGRELFLLALAVAIVVVLGRTPFAVALAVIVSLVTTTVPLRTLALPLAVLLVAAVARTFGLPALRLTWPSTVVLAFVMLFFPWSGIVARAFPYFLLRAATPEQPRIAVGHALAPNRSETYAVPDGATHLIVSGANVANFRRGAILGRIMVSRQSTGGSRQEALNPADCQRPTVHCIDVRIGDVADWGYVRREAWHKAHNPLPRDAAGKVRDYGYDAWVDGAGRIPLPRDARTIRVTADGALPAHASLQVEGFE